MTDELFKADRVNTYADVARCVARLRGLRGVDADGVERVLLAGLPPREPGADEEEPPRAVIDGDEDTTIGELVGAKAEVASGSRNRVADILKARAGARR